MFIRARRLLDHNTAHRSSQRSGYADEAKRSCATACVGNAVKAHASGNTLVAFSAPTPTLRPYNSRASPPKCFHEPYPTRTSLASRATCLRELRGKSSRSRGGI